MAATKGIKPGFETLRFQIHAEGLPNKDPIGAKTSDPFARVYAQRGGAWFLLGESEVLRENENPKWEFEFVDTAFSLGKNQYYKIEIWDKDVGKDDLCGSAIVSADAYYKGSELRSVPLSEQGTVTIKKSTAPSILPVGH